MRTDRHGSVPARVWQSLHARLAHGRATLRTWQHRRRERHNLHGLLCLDDRLLEDIGLHRFSLIWEARRPFRKPESLNLW
jgi:uncharacterized protein YjiS (DUF1127 family)